MASLAIMLDVSAAPVMETCANCGAPLELDPDGACRWCHTRVHREPPALPLTYYGGGLPALVPAEADDCFSSAPFLYLMLSTLGPLLSTEPAVQEFIREQPAMYQQIRKLSGAASAAGVRVRDAGLIKDDFDDNLHVYTPAEIWVFDLAFDVIAMLGALGGLSGSTRAKVASDLRSLDDRAHSHIWKKELKKAGAGPQEFGSLRTSVPQRP